MCTARDTLSLTLQHLLSSQLSTSSYDLIVCGTGYDRTSWIKLITSSNLSKRFGIAPGTRTSDVQILSSDGYGVAQSLSDDAGLASMVGRGRGNARETSPSASVVTDVSSAPSTPLTPALSSLAASTELVMPMTMPGSHSRSSIGEAKLYVSRAYRLLPAAELTSVDDAVSGGKGEGENEGKRVDGRIYLQGCTEATHGLSDTLLSVMAVKAGEVVDDLCRC